MIRADLAEVFGTRNAPVEAVHTWKRDGKLKQPFAVARADDTLSAFGGIWPTTDDPLRSKWRRRADVC